MIEQDATKVDVVRLAGEVARLTMLVDGILDLLGTIGSEIDRLRENEVRHRDPPAV